MAAQLTLPAGSVGKTKLKAEPVRQRHLKRTALIVCIVIGVLLSAASIPTAIFVYNSYNTLAEIIDQQIAGGYLKGHAGLYAAPRVIEKGARVSKEQIVASLQRAGYVLNASSNIWSGSYEVTENTIRIMPRKGTGTVEWIEIAFDKRGTIASLSSNEAGNLRSFALEPELLTVDAGLKIGHQQTVTYNDIPPVMIQAILAIEDRRFFQHSGVDLRGVSRAFLSWVTSGSIKFQQGGSTITQQLVKNTYLTPEKTLKRKFNEAMLALALEQRLSKEDIFALYCNEVYLGQRNGVGVRGIAQAARIYFGKELKDLSLSEAATIAGMIQSPARYAPDRHPEAAKSRRDQVIAAMMRNGAIDENTAQRETATAVGMAAFESSTNEFAPYYLDAVNRAMESSQGANAETDQNLRIQTTIDPDLQAAAENALRHQLEILSKSRKGKTQPQGALVALDVHSGKVLAMVGGRNYAESQLNRATDAKRQPGSVFKPIVYATAFDSGISPLSVYRDAPQTFEYGRATYAPDNYGRSYAMRDLMLREGLIRSLNVVTVDLALRTGLHRVAETAARLGLPRPDAYPSMALGTFEATPLQIASAYAAFANGGTMVEPTFLAGVMDSSGEQMLQPTFETRQVLNPTTAYMITDLLSDVIKRGTARRANGSFASVAIAGKTGTSRDGWFVGYTPNLVCVVWIGFDDNKQLGMTGAEAALPAWIEFMKEALSVRPSLGGSSFSKPNGIITVKIDPETGELAGPDCPSSQTLNVSLRFAPRLECFKHLPQLDYEIDSSYLESPFDSPEADPESAPDVEVDEVILEPPVDIERSDSSEVQKPIRHVTPVDETVRPRSISQPRVEKSTPKPKSRVLELPDN